MQHDNEIDKLFRDKLEEAHMPEIPQGYLDDINKRLDHLPSQKKKRRYLGFFWLVALLGISSLVLHFTLFNNSTSDKLKNDVDSSSANHSSTNNETTVISQNNRSTAAEDNTHSSSLKTSDLSSGSTNILKENKINNPSNSGTDKSDNPVYLKNINSLDERTNNKTITFASIANIEGSKNRLSENKNNNKKNAINEESNPTEVENRAILNNTAGQQNLNATITDVVLNNDPKKAENNLPNSGSKENKIELPVARESKTDSLKTIMENTLQVNKKDSLNITKAQLPANSTNPDSLKKAASDTLAIAAKDSAKKTVPDTSKALSTGTENDVSKGIMSIQLLIGMNKVYSFYKQKNSIYNNKRKQEESPVWVYDASLLFDYTRKRFVYSVGINYSQWGEKINYKPTTDSVSYLSGYDTTYVTQQTDPNTFVTNGYISAEYKNKAVINDKLTAHNGVNIYSYVSIPFLLGYKLGDEFFSVTPKIGGMAGIPIQSKGYYISNDLTELVKEKAAPWLLNFQVSADLQSKLSSHISLCIAPVYRYNLTPLIHSENTVNQYAGIGMNVGLSYIIH